MAIGTGHRLDDIAQDLFEVFTRLGLSALRGRRRLGDLKEAEFLTLSLLHTNGTMIVGDIQKLLGVLPAQMSRIIRSLENRERPLIVCNINARDKRKVDVGLTVAGEKALDEYQSARVGMLVERLQRLADDEIEGLGQLGHKLNDVLDRHAETSSN
jgi:DNA-binding MarR family transcriptional regulator